MSDPNLADMWLAGWDTARMGRPASACPFTDAGRDHSLRSMWRQGWAAGCRNQPQDRQVKNKFLALSIGKPQ